VLEVGCVVAAAKQREELERTRDARPLDRHADLIEGCIVNGCTVTQLRIDGREMFNDAMCWGTSNWKDVTM
jgi:hypothetical protein